jgi:hypothetical protein
VRAPRDVGDPDDAHDGGGPFEHVQDPPREARRCDDPELDHAAIIGIEWGGTAP